MSELLGVLVPWCWLYSVVLMVDKESPWEENKIRGKFFSLPFRKFWHHYWRENESLWIKLIIFYSCIVWEIWYTCLSCNKNNTILRATHNSSICTQHKLTFWSHLWLQNMCFTNDNHPKWVQVTVEMNHVKQCNPNCRIKAYSSPRWQQSLFKANWPALSLAAHYDL